MKKILVGFCFLFSVSTVALSSFELMGETKYIYTGIRQVLGVTYKSNKSANSIFIGYDKAFSMQHNAGIGYQYSYTFNNGFGADANVFGRFGKELHTGSAEFGGAVYLCTGKFVLEEALGFHYHPSKTYFENRLSLSPFARISFAQGFDQEQEIAGANLSYKCEVPLRYVSLLYMGIRTSFKLK